MRKKNIFTYFFLIGNLIIFSLIVIVVLYSLNTSNLLGKEKESFALISSEHISPEPEDDLPKAKPIEEPESVEILISSIGDCTLGTDEKFYKPHSLPGILLNNNNDYSYFFSNVSSIFEQDDFTTANLETTFTNSSNKRGDRQFNFKGDPSLAKALTLGSIEGVTLSNNHIYDYLDQGFQDTISTLKKNHINYFGEGNIYRTNIKGVKFGFLGYTGWSNDAAFLEKMKMDIQNLKSEGYIVIINIHWGEEGKYSPNNIQKSLAHSAIDSGADLIIGHHPHVIQGIEKYKDRYICYSLANFCFGGNSNPTDKDTFILQSSFKFTNNKLQEIGIKIIPCSVSSVANKNDYRPTPMQDSRKNKFLDKLNTLSINLDFEVSDNMNYIKLQ